jgi:hypothetical protein
MSLKAVFFISLGVTIAILGGGAAGYLLNREKSDAMWKKKTADYVQKAESAKSTVPSNSALQRATSVPEPTIPTSVSDLDKELDFLNNEMVGIGTTFGTEELSTVSP